MLFRSSTNFYNEWVKSELLQDDLWHLGVTLDMVWSLWLVELHENGPVDFVNPGGTNRATDPQAAGPGKTVGLEHSPLAAPGGFRYEHHAAHLYMIMIKNIHIKTSMHAADCRGGLRNEKDNIHIS